MVILIMTMKNLLKSIMAGFALSFGCIIYITLHHENHILGAALFSIGLLMIYMFDWNLYTGKACYIVENASKWKSYSGVVFTSFVGNLIGTSAMAFIMQHTKLESLVPIAEEVAASKLSGTPFSTFIMGIGCGVMMYVAVDSYKHSKDIVGKYLLLIMAIVIFTISGFEHVVANMFYYTMGNAWDLKTVVYLLICCLGNTVGCSLIPFTKKFSD